MGLSKERNMMYQRAHEYHLLSPASVGTLMPRGMPRDPIFSWGCFCLGVFSGLFLGDGLVMGLSLSFRSMRVP